MDDFDRGLRKLLDDETAGIRLDSHGAPIDPAQTVRHDRERAFQLLEMQAREREAIEAHWGRWGQVMDRQEAYRNQTRTQTQPSPTGWAAQQGAPVVVNINLGGAGAPYYQPAPPAWQPPQVGPLFNPVKAEADDRRFMRKLVASLVACGLATVAMLYMLAGAMQYRAEQYLSETPTTQAAP